jgi:N-acetylneuraminic acid mutarotase
VQKQNPPYLGRFLAVSFAIGGKGYIGTGNLANSSLDQPIAANDFYEYDPILDNWIIRNSAGPTGRYGAVSFVISGKAYVAYGGTSTVAYYIHPHVGEVEKSVYEFNPNNGVWSFKGESPVGAIQAQAFVINLKAYVFGGFVPAIDIDPETYDDATTMRYNHEYDPLTNSWTSKALIPQGQQRHGAITFSLLDRGYSFGGYISLWDFWPGGDTFNSHWQSSTSNLSYNPYLDQWSTNTTPLPTGAIAATSHVENCGYGYFTTGRLEGGPYSVQTHKYENLVDGNYIQGPSLVCSTASSFSLLISNVGTVTWSTTSNLSITSGQGTKNVQIRSLQSGSGTITASMVIECRTVQFQKSVWSGTPHITNQKVDGNNYYPNYPICNGSHYLTVTPVGGNASTATWTVPSGITYYVGTNLLNFVYQPYNPSSIAITTRSTNSCGQGANYAFYLTRKTWGCGSYLLSYSPNPADEDLTVEVLAEQATSEEIELPEIEEVTLVNDRGTILKISADRALRHILDVRDIPKGEYYLHIRVAGEVVKERVRIKK